MSLLRHKEMTILAKSTLHTDEDMKTWFSILGPPQVGACAAMGLALILSWPALAQEDKGPASLPSKGSAGGVDIQHDQQAGGDHWRLAQGDRVMHVWKPPGFRRAFAGIVVYVPDYNLTVDQAWSSHDLSQQFLQSKRNALFVAVSGPVSTQEHVKFRFLGEILKMVRRHTELRMPPGKIVVVAYGAGFRMVLGWLRHRRLHHVILMDALYGNEDQFQQWLTYTRRHGITVVAKKMLYRSTRFIRRFKQGVIRDNIPESYGGFTRKQRRARILLLESQYEHTDLLKNQQVIPTLLRLTKLQRIR